MAQILNFSKDTEMVYPIYLSMEAGTDGAVLVIREEVDEKLYNQLRMTTETKIGKVELGRTKKDGVTLKIVVSKPNLISDALEQILIIARDVVEKGIQDDKGFNNNPRRDLQLSLEHIQLYFDDVVTANTPFLTRFPYINYSTVSNNPRFINLYNRAKLIPDGYEAEYK